MYRVSSDVNWIVYELGPSWFGVNEDVTFFYINESLDNYWCDICKEIVSEGHMYWLLEWNENFHVECLVPSVLDHHHQLILTSSVERKTETRKYCCNVCKEEEDFEHYVYHCEGCYFNAHVECLFNEVTCLDSFANYYCGVWITVTYFARG